MLEFESCPTRNSNESVIPARMWVAPFFFQAMHTRLIIMNQALCAQYPNSSNLLTTVTAPRWMLCLVDWGELLLANDFFKCIVQNLGCSRTFSAFEIRFGQNILHEDIIRMTRCHQSGKFDFRFLIVSYWYG